MTWTLTPAELESVCALDGKDRYLYCIKKIADENQLWSLRGVEGWVLASDDAGHELVPVWPHKEFASLCAHGSWSECSPEVITAENWITRWIPGIEKDGRLVAVFPTSRDTGTSVEASRMERDLRNELAKYE